MHVGLTPGEVHDNRLSGSPRRIASTNDAVGRSRALRAGAIGKEQLLTAYLVIGDGPLTFRGNEPIHEGLSVRRLHAGVLRRIDQHHAVLIEQPAIAFHQDRKLAAILAATSGECTSCGSSGGRFDELIAASVVAVFVVADHLAAVLLGRFLHQKWRAAFRRLPERVTTAR